MTAAQNLPFLSLLRLNPRLAETPLARRPPLGAAESAALAGSKLYDRINMALSSLDQNRSELFF